MRLTRTIRGNQIVVNVPPSLAPLGDDLLTKLAELDAKGPGLREGSTIAFGWAKLTLKDDVDELVVVEPDYSGDALHDTFGDVGDTLRVIANQLRVCKRVGATPQDTWYASRVLFKRGALDERCVYLERRSPRHEDDSGWYIGPAEGPAEQRRVVTADDLDSMYVYELHKRRRELLDAMALPVGYLAVFSDSAIVHVLDPQNEDVWPGYEDVGDAPNQSRGE
ncbi:immunity protein Imm33 domain-containing protein [Sorangium sp. So ce341]|uniref:immunity protein Imm33 domain-containing protein n=1 Tax=Sorangium sp. So ce341 TaxID=3133302 RepID=UPI003F5E2E4A